MDDAPVSPSYEGFETLDALQKANLCLLRSWRRPYRAPRGREGDAAVADGVDVAPLEAFVTRSRATGARLSSATSREVAQAALDYWTTELAAAHAASAGASDSLLKPFDPKALPALAGTSPFIGLSPFLESDAPSYFGREAAAAALAHRIERLPIVIVQGPSGSGKSSLIAAGLLPELRRSGFLSGAPGEPPASGQRRLVHVHAAGRDPIATLVGAVLPAPAGSNEVARRVGLLRAAPEQAEAQLTSPGEANLFVIIDQFEEIFTLEPRENDPEILARALAALGPRHRVLIGIRDDFLTRLEKLPALGTVASDPENRYTPPPLSPDDLRRAIEAPADRAGLRFEEGVVSDLVRSVAGELAGLPLLQFTLARLWHSKRDNWVSREVAAEVGLPKVALRRTADALYDAMADENKERAERLFLKLVTPAAENEFVRRPQTRAELQNGEDPGRVDDILEAFAAQGLLRRKPGAVPADDRFDVTHEALIRNWPRLRDWLVRFRANHQRFWELRILARSWKERGRDPGNLLSGDALRDAYVFANRSTELAELIEASEAEVRRQQRVERSRARSAVYAILLIAAALIAAGALFVMSQQAAGEARQAESEAKRKGSEAETARLRAERLQIEADKAREIAERRSISEREIKKEQERAQEAIDEAKKHFEALSGAVRALGSTPTDLLPLRALLEQFGATRALTSRLQLGPAVTVPAPAAAEPQLRREDLSETVVEQPSDQVAAPKVDENSTCMGYLWIGDPTNSKVEAFPGSETGLSGRTLTVTSNIRLRSALPSRNSYQAGAPVGVVPKGTRVTGVGDATTYDRSSGRQWWLQVSLPRQVCVTVFIQYAGDEGRLGPFVTRLRGAGFQTAAPEALDSARNRASVRYYFPADEPMARQVADLFAAAPGGRALKLEPLLNWQPKPSQGTIEVWIDLGGQ